MIKKLEKCDGGFALVLDKSVFALVGIDPTKEVQISTDGNTLIAKQHVSSEEQGIALVKKMEICESGFRLVLEVAVFELVGIFPNQDLTIETDGKTLLLKQPKNKATDEELLIEELTGPGLPSGPRLPSRKRRSSGNKRFGFPKKQPW